MDTKNYLWRSEENTLFVASSSCFALALIGSLTEWEVGTSPSSSWECGCGQWNIGHMGIGYSAGSFVELSCQDQPFSYTSGGRYLGGGRERAAGLQLLFFPMNFTLCWFIGNRNCLIISHPRNRRTKMTFEDDFVFFFFSFNTDLKLPLL